MIPLDKDLQKVKKSLTEFGNVAVRVLQYLPNVLTNALKKPYSDYMKRFSELITEDLALLLSAK